MKLVGLVVVVALGACNRGADTVVTDASPDAWPEYHIPLDIDVVVGPTYVHVHLNGSDMLQPDYADYRTEDFPVVDTCVVTGDVLYTPVRCVRRAALVGAGQRYELDLAAYNSGLGGPLPDPLPNDLVLELEGCDSEPARVPIDHAGTATPVIDVQIVGSGLAVSWTSDQPWSSALVTHSVVTAAVQCHTAANAFAFDDSGFSVSVVLLESPAVTTGSWGVARVWAAGKGGSVRLVP